MDKLAQAEAKLLKRVKSYKYSRFVDVCKDLKLIIRNPIFSSNLGPLQKQFDLHYYSEAARR